MSMLFFDMSRLMMLRFVSVVVAHDVYVDVDVDGVVYVVADADEDD